MLNSAVPQPSPSTFPQSQGEANIPSTDGLSISNNIRSSSSIFSNTTGGVIEWGWGQYLLVGVVQNSVSNLWHSWVSVDGGLTIQTLTVNFMYEGADQAARSYALAYEEGRLTGLSRDQLVSFVGALPSDVQLPQELPTDALIEIGEFIRRLKIYPQQGAVYASVSANSPYSSPSAITAPQTTSPSPSHSAGADYGQQPPLRRRAWQSR